MRRNRAGAVALCVLCLAGGAAAQEGVPNPPPAVSWNVDVSATGAFTPGIGAATNGLGAFAAVSLIRSAQSAEFAPTTCLAGVFTYGWTGSSRASSPSGERWFLGGVRWDGHDAGEAAFPLIQVLGGIKRGRSGLASARRSHVAFGAEVALPVAMHPVAGFPLAGRFIDVTYLVTPGDRESRHRLLLSAGLDITLLRSPRSTGAP